MNDNERTAVKQDCAPWTYATAPADKKYKWDFYFREAPQQVRENIQMDEEGTYSVTDMVSAKKTTLLIKDKLREVLGIAGHEGSILDGCACIGGNTISFAQHFHKVTAIELSKARCKMLQHNLDLFQLRQNVEIIEGDFTKVIDSLPKFDVIFLDPPWGGEGYRQSKVLDISFGGRPLVDVCNSLIGKANILALKLPTNFNIVPFRQRLDSRCRIIAENYKVRKTLIILITMPGTRAAAPTHPVDASYESSRFLVNDSRSSSKFDSCSSSSSTIPPLLPPSTLKRPFRGGYDEQDISNTQQSDQVIDTASGATGAKGKRYEGYLSGPNNPIESNSRKRSLPPEPTNDVSGADQAKRVRQLNDASNNNDFKAFPDHL